MKHKTQEDRGIAYIMPQEQSCVGVCAAHPASKNAKDKRNSVSLLSRTKVHTMQVTNGRNSRCSSEKDSGYSDAGSDYQQTDVDDQHSPVTELRGHKSHSTADQGNHILVSGQADFTPMFVLRNVVLKQPGQSGQDQVLHSLWGSEGTNAQSNLLLLQQPGITVSPLHVLRPQLRRTGTKNKKSKNMYLPILNSYPRIAPNLNKKPPEKLQTSRECSSEEHSLSKRVCIEETKEEVSISTQVPEKHPNKQLERHFLSHSNSFFHSLSSSGESVKESSCLPTPELETVGTSAVMGFSSSSFSSSKTPPPSFPLSSSCSEPAALLLPTSKMSLSGGSVPNSTMGLTRHRRFLNTVEILSQSGLLDITLRTQELLRQSAATEQNITQLRQHAHLLCQAVDAGSNVPSLEKIHRAMVECGCYPNLRRVLLMGSDDREMETNSTCRYAFNGQGEVAPPSPLLTTEPIREGRDLPSADQKNATFGMEWSRARWKRPPPRKLLVPPDSSTGVAVVDMYTD